MGEPPLDFDKVSNEPVNEATCHGLGVSQCTKRSSAAGVGAGAAAQSVDPKAPKAQTEASCKEWECWDGYACGPCEQSEE